MQDFSFLENYQWQKEDKMKKVTKKLLAVVMVLTLAGSVVNSNVTFANGQETAKKVSVMYSVYCGEWIFKPQVIEVSADLSDKYADKIGYNDTIEEPSILDATIAAHIAIFGENFEEDAGDFKLSAYGWVETSFGMETTGVGYRLNGTSAMSFDEAVADNDCVEYMFYQDTAAWSDSYVSFETANKTVKSGATVELTASAEGYNSNYEIIKSPASELKVLVNDEEVGTTDENGKISFVVGEEGIYVVTLAGTLGSSPIFSSYCVLTVTNEEESTTENATTAADETQTTIPNLKRVTVKSIKNVKKYKAKIRINKVSKATGYQYKYALNKKLKNAVVKNTTKTSFVTKKLKKGKTCFVKVRAYVTVNKTRHYGLWSKIKRVQIRK
jgi:hypothetical protein